MGLLERYGMKDEERKQRQAFVGLTEEDAAHVRQLRAVFADHAAQFAQRFYDHLLSNAHTARFLQDAKQLEHLKRLQADYFSDLLEGVFDAKYFESRLRVGLTHQRIGLVPVWYLGAYNQYIQLTFPLFVRAFGDNLEEVLPLLLSLVKVIFLDIGLALDTYFTEATEQLRRRNEELQRALELYWNSQQREEQFRKMISHEIRGGLAAVITSLEDLCDVAAEAADEGGSLERSTVEQMDNVRRRCWSLSNLLGEMLVPSNRSGPTWIDTNPIFQSLLERFGLYAEGRSIQLELPKNPPRVWADPLQLREVFANLVGNAVHYMDKEQGRVAISWKQNQEGFLFCVADNGPGIPAPIKDTLFEPFVRGPHTPLPGRNSIPPGTGLGLYFVRTVVEHAGGKVWVESEPGQGSKFWFTLPRHNDAE